MEIKDFLQECVNHGIGNITTNTIALVLGLSRTTVYNKMKKLSKEGVVFLFKNGKWSYWDIILVYNGPYIPYNSPQLNDKGIPPINGFDRATRLSMKNNCIRETHFPDIDTKPITVLNTEDGEWPFLREQLKLSPESLRDDGLTIHYF